MTSYNQKVLRHYIVRDDFDRDDSDIHECIGESQAKSGVFPIEVKEYDIRKKNGKLAAARFEVYIYDWKGPITRNLVTKSELKRLLSYYIRYISVATRQNFMKKYGITLDMLSLHQRNNKAGGVLL